MTNYYAEADKMLVAVDSIILGFSEDKLKILIGRRNFDPGKGVWSLYGGFVGRDEDLDDAARRVLYNLTGIKDIYMQQVGTFGKIHRDPGDRVVSVVYCALINVKDYDTSLLKKYNLEWVYLTEMPHLFSDHDEMVALAMEQLRSRVSTEPISFSLLPELFTLTQLQHVYEALLGTPIDKRNFRKRIKMMDFVEKTNLIDKVTSKRGAALYRFNKKIFDSVTKFKM